MLYIIDVLCFILQFCSTSTFIDHFQDHPNLHMKMVAAAKSAVERSVLWNL